MSKDKISDYSATANSNTDIAGINIDEGCAPSGINNAIRTLMKQIKDLYAGTSGDKWPVTAGGTGATTAADARTNLGLAIGTDVQAYDAQLTDIAGLTPTDNGVVIGNGTNFVVESGATLKTSLGLTIGTDVQAYNAELQGISQGGNIGFKNRIINGAMMIDQRNAGASKSASSLGALNYMVDRWFLYPIGAAVTGQQVAGTNIGAPYAFRITGATGNTATGFGQRVENLNVLDLNSTSITVSLKIYASTSISNATVNLYYCSSANSGYGSTSASQAITVASGLNSYSFTFSLPSNASNGFEFNVSFASGIGNGVTVDIGSVQLEKGSTATSFDYRPYGTELALCQRYYYKSFAQGTAPAQNIAANNQIFVCATSNTIAGTVFPVAMRANPTVTTFNPFAANSSFRIPSSSTDVAISGVSVADWGITSFGCSAAASFAVHGHYTASAEL